MANLIIAPSAENDLNAIVDISPRNSAIQKAFSAIRRRPDGKSAGYIHDVIWLLAADFLIRHICSQNEFEACFRRLEQSARTWHRGPTSVNYLDNIKTL